MPDTPHSQDLSKVIHATSHAVLRLNSKRFDKSPYFDKWATEDTIFGIYNTRLYPVSFGEDVIRHYWKLRRSLMLYDVPEKPIDIKGPDAVALLERALTRRIADLKLWKARYAVACTPQGGIIMDGVVIRLAEDHFWYVQANGGFEHWLNVMSEGMDVVVSDPESRVLQVQGPKALEFLERACPGQMPAKFGYFNAGRFSFNGMEAIVSRTGFTGEMGIEIYGNPQNDPSAFWDYLFAVGKAFDLEMGAGGSMTLRRVEAGILDYDMDINPGTTPFDAGLGALVDFDKPSFVGREALMKADRRQRLFGLTSATGIPRVGTQVLHDGGEVARMTIGDWSPTLEKGVGYVLFDAPECDGGPWVGQSLQIRTPDGEQHACEIVALPFFDPDKRIPRGLEKPPA
ncbi:MAG: aminomethyltransferase family protein [Kiloniellales bacterium]